MNKRNQKICIFLSCVLLVILAFGFVEQNKKNNNERIQLEKQAKQLYIDFSKQNENRQKEKASSADEIEKEVQKLALEYCLSEQSGIVINSDDKVHNLENGDRLDIELNQLMGYGLLKMTVKSNADSNSIVLFAIGDNELEYDISTMTSNVYVPIEKEHGEKMSIGCNGNVVISNYEVIAFDKCDSVNSIKNGVWILDKYEKKELTSENILSSDYSSVCISNEKYLYTVENDTLKVYDILSENKAKPIGNLNYIYGARHIAFSSDGKNLIITGRKSGTYLINISNPYEPVLVSIIDNLELVSGLSVVENYVFLCSRYFGVEIYDISDINNPVLCNVIRDSKEFLNCFVNEGILYITVFNESSIEIYDVKNINEPKYLASYKTSGKPYGIYVKDDYLYSTIAVSDPSKKFGDIQYGLQNGFIILDVSDLSSITEVSKSILDARFNTGNYDIFKLTVQDDKVYFSYTYNGVYVYDISNIHAPKIVEHIFIPIYSYDALFTRQFGEFGLYPFNREYQMNGSVLDFSLNNGKIYIAAGKAGMYQSECTGVKIEDNYTNSYEYVYDSSRHDELEIAVDGYDCDWYKCDGNVYSSIIYDNNYIIANGTNGIRIVSDEFKEIEKIDIPGITKDVQVICEKLLCVCSSKGIFILEKRENKYEIVSSFEIMNASDCQVYDNTIVVEGNNITILELVEYMDKFRLKLIQQESFVGLYYRDITSNALSNGLIGVHTYSKTKWWDSINQVWLSSENDVQLSESLGATAYGNLCCAIYNGGYVVYDPKNDNKLDELTVKRIENEFLIGKPIIIGNHLYVSKEYNGELWIINIEDIENPKLENHLFLDSAIDVVSATKNNEVILVPCRNKGIMRLKRKPE